MEAPTSVSPANPAEKYEQFFVPAIFGPWARFLVERADIRQGQSLLDLACGTGIVARTAASILGERGKIVALDLREGMLAVGSGLTAPAGASISWIQADATEPGLPDGIFDHVICQAGLQFFPDKGAALRSALRMLKRGGRLTLLVWQSLGRQPLFQAIAEAEYGRLGPLGVSREEVDMPFSMGNAELLHSLLEEAGFTGIDVAEHVREMRFPQPERFIHNVESAYAAVIPQFAVDPAAFERFLDEVEEETRDVVDRYRRGSFVVMPMGAVVATGHKP